jgi:hypothetical protein
MAEVVVEDVCQVTFDRALRDIGRNMWTSYWLSWRSRGAPACHPPSWSRCCAKRRFRLAIGGYDCEHVDALIESAALGWRTHWEAMQLRDEAPAIRQQLDEALRTVLTVLDQATRQLDAINAARAELAKRADEATRATAPVTNTERHYRVQFGTQ